MGSRTVADIVADTRASTYGVTGLAAMLAAFVAMAREKSYGDEGRRLELRGL